MHESRSSQPSTPATAPSSQPAFGHRGGAGGRAGDEEADRALAGAAEQVRVRAQKRARLIAEGVDPYPVTLPITSTIREVRERFAGLAGGEETDAVVGLAGRLMLSRNAGRLCFAVLQDGEGRRLQAMLSAKEIGRDSLAAYKADVDLGDHLFVHGRVISSRRGELSILAAPGARGVPAWRIASKALRPLPKTYRASDGTERSLSEDTRVRRRYLDLIVRPAAREMVRLRARVLRSLRQYFDGAGFVELETPILQTVHGGAAARPFVTHMNAYDTDLYLRIATELFLKRALIGGVERNYEIGRVFRNEGADSTHSPEFTMLEAYEAYGSYDTMARHTRAFIQKAARDGVGSERVTLPDGTRYDLSGEWSRISLYDAVSEAVGEAITPATPLARLRRLAAARDVELPDHVLAGKVVEELFEKTVAPGLWAPTFVRDFPKDTSPLTRSHRSKPGVTEKWDLYVRGFELATAYSELTDPVDQRARFEQQSREAAAGDPEAMAQDEDFLEAMEQGMPPAGGMGMGLDRLLMALTGQGIRETITFPLVKRL